MSVSAHDPHLSISAVDLTVEMVSQTFAHNRLGKCDAISGMTKAVMSSSVRVCVNCPSRNFARNLGCQDQELMVTQPRRIAEPQAILRYHRPLRVG